MSEVGALIISLRAETAQFRADMGKVKTDLNDLKGISQETGSAMDFSMHEARGSMMLLGEETGVRIPRHLQALIATIPGVGAAFAAMLPLVGVAAAVMVIVKLIDKIEEQKKAIKEAGEAWDKVGKVTENALTSIDNKITESELKIAELNKDYLEALHLKLQIIDNTTLAGISSEFDKLSKTAIEALDKLEKSTKHMWLMKLFEGSGDLGGAKEEITSFMDVFDRIFT